MMESEQAGEDYFFHMTQFHKMYGNKSLRELSLSSNGLTEVGAADLAHTMSLSTVLTSLDIRYAPQC